MLQFTGSAPINVTRYHKQVVRCNRCGQCFSPASQIHKWEASARTSIMLQKAHGMPFHRLAKLQSLCGVPVSSSTAWQQCEDVWQEGAAAVYESLLCLAAQSDLLYVDDTGAKILDVIAANKELPPKKVKGSHTTIVRGQTADKQKFVIYMTDQKTAGRNLGPLLQQRLHPHHTLKMMSDASTMNTIVFEADEDTACIDNLSVSRGYCMEHAARKLRDLLPSYPELCGYFIEQVQMIYHHERLCKNYSSRQRLKYHKRHSAPYIKNIYRKIHRLFRDKEIEPNSDLGRAMRYWLNHRKPLTAFLRIKGMPLHNNPSEEGLRSMILQRKNSYFFKSIESARVLSGLHSLIKTCEVNDINSFAYLNWLQDQGSHVIRSPQEYLPFAYQKQKQEQEQEQEQKQKIVETALGHDPPLAQAA